MTTKARSRKPVKEQEIVQDEIIDAEAKLMNEDEAKESKSLVIRMDDYQQFKLSESELTDKAWLAIESLRTGIPPLQAVSEHPGRGGKMFKYVSHVWATKLMNWAFGHRWEYHVRSVDVYEDYSASAICQMVYFLPIKNKDGEIEYWKRTITEVGSFEAQKKIQNQRPAIVEKARKKPAGKTPTQAEIANGQAKIDLELPPVIDVDLSDQYGMSKAMIAASAASRGLLRCMLRAFGFGSEFYEEFKPLNKKAAWNYLLEFGLKRGLLEEEIIELLKSNGFTSDDLMIKEKNESMIWLVLDKAMSKDMKNLPDSFD